MAKKSVKAMVKGDPERMGVMEKAVRGKLHEFTAALTTRGH
jgi:hypothetical protein